MRRAGDSDSRTRSRDTTVAAAGRSSILAGPAEECVAGIRAVADAGAELILLNPLVDDAQQLERLAAEVIPALS